jgi:hypothetical protein
MVLNAVFSCEGHSTKESNFGSVCKLCTNFVMIACCPQRKLSIKKKKKKKKKKPYSLLLLFCVLLFLFLFFFFPELRTEPRALHLLGKHSTVELNPQPLVYYFNAIPCNSSLGLNF